MNLHIHVNNVQKIERYPDFMAISSSVVKFGFSMVNSFLYLAIASLFSATSGTVVKARYGDEP